MCQVRLASGSGPHTLQIKRRFERSLKEWESKTAVVEMKFSATGKF